MAAVSAESPPDVAIALLTRNAGPLLKRLLDAVAAQDTARQIEIVAADSGSTDTTLADLAHAGARILSIAPEDFDFGRSRDTVFENTRAPVIISLSQDAVPAHEHWLEHLVAPLAEPDVAVACGRSIPDPHREMPQFPWERNGYFYFTREIQQFVSRYGRGLSNANAAYRRAVWEELRFGPQAIGEDFRFQTKLEGTPWRAAFPGDAPVWHHHDYRFGALVKRCRNEGMGLRELGCPYGLGDCIRDLLSPRKYWVALREAAAGRLCTPAAWCFPVLRPLAVYAGSRFGRRFWP